MIEKKEIWIPCFQDKRMLHIYVPDSALSENRRYPVLYMYDGHNLFSDEEATYGKSWGMKEYLDQAEEELIIVGLECNHEGNMRLSEFSPYDFEDKQVGWIHGQGKALMEWMSQDLRLYINSIYPTLPGREYTGIAGSSMGGLMALYSILAHNDIYSKAAVLSPFLYPIADKIYEELDRVKLSMHTKTYISWGSDEFRSKNQLAYATERNLAIAHELTKRKTQVYPRLIAKGRHNEASWEQELPVFLPYLFLNRS